MNSFLWNQFSTRYLTWKYCAIQQLLPPLDPCQSWIAIAADDIRTLDAIVVYSFFGSYLSTVCFVCVFSYLYRCCKVQNLANPTLLIQESLYDTIISLRIIPLEKPPLGDADSPIWGGHSMVPRSPSHPLHPLSRSKTLPPRSNTVVQLKGRVNQSTHRNSFKLYFQQQKRKQSDNACDILCIITRHILHTTPCNRNHAESRELGSQNYTSAQISNIIIHQPLNKTNDKPYILFVLELPPR